MKNDMLVDRFGRPNFMTVSSPFDIRSERITNGGGTINSAVLLQGWLRVQASSLISRPEVPKAAGLADAMPGMESAPPGPNEKKANFFKQGPRLNAGGVATTAPPINTKSEGFKMLMNEENGMMVNPSYVDGTNTPAQCKSCFYFRLSGLNLQFTQVREDMTVVGAIAIKNVADVMNAQGPGDCFRVVDNEKDNWVLCTGSSMEKSEWTCAIKYALGQPCQPDNLAKNIIEEKQKIIKPLWIIPMPSPICNEKWNQNQVGHNWNCKCFEGQLQSPIDLPGQSQCKEEKEPIVMDYAEANTFNGAGLKLVNDENMLRIRADDFGSLLSPEGVTQQAVEMVFHTPSDHTIMGKRQPMEIQILHKATSEGDIGKKAIVSVLVDTIPGVKNEFFDALDQMNLPTPNDPERPIQSGIDINKLFADNSEKAGQGVSFSQWRYSGSVPFPPCDERTDVFVKSDPITMGMSVAQLFKESLVALDPETGGPAAGAVNHFGNSRSQQPMNNRRITFFNDSIKCAEERLQKIASELSAGGINGDSGFKGHWEKVEKKQSKFFFVDNNKASGVPGAFVVPEKSALNLQGQ